MTLSLIASLLLLLAADQTPKMDPTQSARTAQPPATAANSGDRTDVVRTTWPDAEPDTPPAPTALPERTPAEAASPPPTDSSLPAPPMPALPTLPEPTAPQG